MVGHIFARVAFASEGPVFAGQLLELLRCQSWSHREKVRGMAYVIVRDDGVGTPIVTRCLLAWLAVADSLLQSVKGHHESHPCDTYYRDRLA